MENLKKVFVLFLIASILLLYFPRVTLAEEASYYAQADIKKHSPEVLSMPEEDIPTTWWPWVVLGIVLVAVVVYILIPKDGKDGTPSTNTGSVSVGW